MSRAPLTREARKEQTREAIVTAATKLFTSDGIEATSLDRIAGEIGLTKGAIYSTFASKADLVDAVATANSISVGEELIFDPKVPIKKVLRTIAEELLAMRKRFSRNQFVLYLELFLYERRHGAWREKIAAENRARLEVDVARFESAMSKRDETLIVTSAEFFTAVSALATGIVLMLERDPKSLSNEAVVKMFESLAE